MLGQQSNVEVQLEATFLSPVFRDGSTDHDIHSTAIVNYHCLSIHVRRIGAAQSTSGEAPAGRRGLGIIKIKILLAAKPLDGAVVEYSGQVFFFVSWGIGSRLVQDG